MKYGVIQRNGVASSADATMTEHFIRHGDYLTLVTIVDDPVYLEEPFIRTSQWVRTSNITLDQRFIFEVVDEVAGHPQGYVPHYPLGTRQDGYAKNHGLPFEATQGGKETIYPEYELKLRQMLADMAAANGGRRSEGRRTRWRLRTAAGACRCRRSPRAGAQQQPTARALTEPWPEIVKVDGIEILHVQKGVYMLVGGGANVAVQIGEEGVTLVDSGGAGQGEKIVAAVRHLTKKPLRYLVNTSADADNVGGNEAHRQGGGRHQRAGGQRTAAARTPAS